MDTKSAVWEWIPLKISVLSDTLTYQRWEESVSKIHPIILSMSSASIPQFMKGKKKTQIGEKEKCLLRREEREGESNKTDEGDRDKGNTQ